jgi:hypothetical protein
VFEHRDQLAMSAYVNGVENANAVFDGFANGQVAAGNAASGTGDAAITGLGFTPDWVVATMAGVNALTGWSATSTTLTITGRSTTTACVISYIAGNLS